jgi:transmembrane 9 superfamily protein 2/4
LKSTLINFYSSFDFCQAKDDEKAPQENLGQVVFGDRINASPYKLSFLKNDLNRN